MRILFIANTLPPSDLSGVGVQVVQLAAGLEARGHEVRIVGRPARGLGARKALFPLAVLPATLRALRELRPEVVQVHESDGALAAALVRLLGPLLSPTPRLLALLQVSYVEERRAVRPLEAEGVTMGRPSAVERRFRWLKAPLQILLGIVSARLADTVLAPSSRTAEELERDYGAERVAVLPNVTGGLAAAGDGVAAADVAAPYLLFVGRLRIRKGVEVLLEAQARLKRRGEGLPLVIAGEGEHRAILERRAAQLGLETTVRFLGRCTPDRVRGLLASARALVVPSIYEGMPLVVLEAMDAGVGVVASSVSGIPEVVVEGETGWLVPAEDPAALARALHEAGQPGEAARRGAAGRRRVDRLYRPEHAAARWEELLREP